MATHQKPARRKLFIVVMVVAVVIVLLPIIFFVQRSVSTRLATRAAHDKVAAARADAERTLDQALSDKIALLKRAGVVDAAIASSKIDKCRTTSEDRGWIPQNWRQDCSLHYAEGFTTSLSREQVISRLQADPDTEALFGEAYTPRSTRGQPTCSIFRKDRQDNLIFRPARTTSMHSTCEVPEDDRARSREAIQAFREFDPKAIDDSQNQVWVVFQENYYQENLGCGGIPIWCSNPRSEPVQASIP